MKKKFLFSILSFKETVVFKLGFFYIETWLFNGAEDQSGEYAAYPITYLHTGTATFKTEN